MEAEKMKEQLKKEIKDGRGFIERSLDNDIEAILTDKVELPLSDLSVLPETVAALREEVDGMKGFLRDILKSGDYRKGEIACKEAIEELQRLEKQLEDRGNADVHCKAVLRWMFPIVWQLEALTKDQIRLNALTANGQDSGERF